MADIQSGLPVSFGEKNVHSRKLKSSKYYFSVELSARLSGRNDMAPRHPRMPGIYRATNIRVLNEKQNL